MCAEIPRFRPFGVLTAVILSAILVQPVLAQAVVPPAEITNLLLDKSGNDVLMAWDATTEDAAGSPHSATAYKIYRGTVPDFVPDKPGSTNLIGTEANPQFTDPAAGGNASPYFYLVSAVDGSGNESNTRPSTITTIPVLDGFWTSSTIEVDWTAASPAPVSYRVYYGKSSRQYEQVDDVGLDLSKSLGGLQTNVNWYIAVTAIDADGNETLMSNEHIDAVNGTVVLRVHDGDELCWGAGDCTPADPDKIQRADGWQLLVPTHFPEGDWTSVSVRFTMESRLCTPPAQGTTSKCGPGNPCPVGNCNGGYNPCGDPWDRLAHLFVVLDDCVAEDVSCITHNNLELIRAVTPFGTDAFPPDGNFQVKPRNLNMDITPFAPLLTGDKYVGVEIGHFVQKGWWVTVVFTFTERPEIASPEPPADGFQIIGFGGFSGVEQQVTVPPEATDVKMRLFTTGHGGEDFCDGGANDAMPCTTGADCPGGVCDHCDEFCQRENQILVDNNVVWSAVPWRTDCNGDPNDAFDPTCDSWNACGTQSCTFSRAGWCPGYIACHCNDDFGGFHPNPCTECDNDIDVTTDVVPGGTYDIDYNVTPVNGSWPVSLVLYWYE